jgi:hypothetical protein
LSVKFWRKSSHERTAPSLMSKSERNLSLLHSVSPSSEEIRMTPLPSISTSEKENIKLKMEKRK